MDVDALTSYLAIMAQIGLDLALNHSLYLIPVMDVGALTLPGHHLR